MADPASPQPRVVFLSYVGRSGSTTFAKRLAKEGLGVAVIPEMRTLEFLMTRASDDVGTISESWLKEVLQKDAQLTQYLDGKDAAPLRERILSCDDWTAAIIELAAAALGSPTQDLYEASAIVFKFGDAAFSWPAITGKIPTAEFLYLHRHPCAVVSSKLNTQRAYHPGEDMGRGDPWHCAATWDRHVRKGAGVPGGTVLSFDEVLSGDAISQLSQAWGLVPSELVFDFALAEAESALHTLADSPAVASRSSAWQDELPHNDARLVATLAEESAARFDYQMPAPLDAKSLRAARVRHLASLVQHGRRRLRFVVEDPRLVRRHLSTRLRRYLPTIGSAS